MQYPSTATGVGRLFTNSYSREEMKEFHEMIALIVNGCTLADPEELPPHIYYEWYECIVTRKRNSIWQDTIVKNCGFGNGGEY